LVAAQRGFLSRTPGPPPYPAAMDSAPTCSSKKVEIGPAPQDGWAKHFFYEIEPDRFIAFWELHGEPYAKPFETGLSKAAGLPEWVNHISFYSPTRHLGQKRDMWLSAGYDVMEIWRQRGAVKEIKNFAAERELTRCKWRLCDVDSGAKI
jgi:hypothetical protein